MKKIGILTTYFASNYGAMLQPFALKRVLENKGFDVEMIRYKQRDVYEFYNPFFLPKYLKLDGLVGNLFYFPQLAIRELKFRKFCKKYINHQSGFEKQIPEDKDYYFIGSDQLWRTFGTDEHFDSVYLGYFDSKEGAKKVAYAVSGDHISFSEHTRKVFIDGLHNFDFISVREQNKADHFKEISGINEIDVVLDPTLLAEPEIFNELETINPLPNKKYVLFYCIRNCAHFLPKAYDYAQEKGADLLILSEGISRGLYSFARSHSNTHYMPTVGEESFLGAMKNAIAIFTPSFHGTAFSLINHKNVYQLLLDDGKDARASELLCSLGITNRSIRVNDSIDETPIDYEEAERRLKLRRDHSINFINKALGIE